MFEKKKAKPTAPYLLMTSDSQLLAKGELTSPPDAINMQLTITEGDVDALVEAGTLQAVPVRDDFPTRLGRVILRRGRQLVLEPLRDLSAAVRQNLRMPVDFDSYVYPSAGGRALIHALDLSCGGVAFSTSRRFEPHEIFEVVIPITEEGPLIVNAEILREISSTPPLKYASQFVDLIHDQEARLREAVFHVQLSRKLPSPMKRQGTAPQS